MLNRYRVTFWHRDKDYEMCILAATAADALTIAQTNHGIVDPACPPTAWRVYAVEPGEVQQALAQRVAFLWAAGRYVDAVELAAQAQKREADTDADSDTDSDTDTDDGIREAAIAFVQARRAKLTARTERNRLLNQHDPEAYGDLCFRHGRVIYDRGVVDRYEPESESEWCEHCRQALPHHEEYQRQVRKAAGAIRRLEHRVRKVVAKED